MHIHNVRDYGTFFACRMKTCDHSLWLSLVADLVAKDGIKLQQCWDPLPCAYLGTTVPNFPNLFVACGPNVETGHVPNIDD